MWRLQGPQPVAQVPHAQDLALVQRVLAKDRGAFDAFFAEYFPRLYRFSALRLRDDALAEDIVQETLLKALKGLHQYRGEASLFTWLCQICRREISDWARRSGVKQMPLVALDDVPEIQAALESLQAEQEGIGRTEDVLATEQLVHLTLDYLPDNYGTALEWKYVEGLTVDEMAQRLNTTVVSVQSLLARARKAFRRSYTDLQHELGATAR